MADPGLLGGLPPDVWVNARWHIETEADSPYNLRATDIGQRYVALAWETPAPDPNRTAIVTYELRVGAGAWTDLESTALQYRVDGLDPATTYVFTVRARTSSAGTAAAALAVTTLAIGLPSPPIYPSAAPTGGRSLDLTWRPPRRDGGSPVTGYEVCVMDEDGREWPWEPATGSPWRIRGLAWGHRYRFRVRALNAAGAGTPSVVFQGEPEPARAIPELPAGRTVPLIDADRQSLIVRLGGHDCRIRVWWQPSDESWWGSLEVPANTPVASSRRLVTDGGLLDHLPGILPGNLVMRELGGALAEPGRDAFSRRTHALRWEPSGN